jgi:hypothetical protein
MTTVEKIQRAYAADAKSLPKWEELSAEMREAFIRVFAAGRLDAQTPRPR